MGRLKYANTHHLQTQTKDIQQYLDIQKSLLIIIQNTVKKLKEKHHSYDEWYLKHLLEDYYDNGVSLWGAAKEWDKYLEEYINEINQQCDTDIAITMYV